MSALPAPPSPIGSRPRPRTPSAKPRHLRAYIDDEPLFSRRSALVGIIGTILFHLLFGYGAQFGLQSSRFAQVQEDQGTELDLELQPDEEEPPTRNPQFTETNPEAPENIPDDTDNFAARNQQAANPDPVDELSPDKTPARDGEDDPDFNRAISGTLEPEVAATPAPPSPQVDPQPQTSTPTRKDPLAGFEKESSENEEGTGSSIANASKNPTPAEQKVEGEDEKSEDTDPKMVAVEASPAQRPSPQPRPRVPRVTPGPVKRQPLGVTQTGQIAVSANFSQYGEYLERVVEAVSQRWNDACAQRSFSESSVKVVLRFKITREGMIRELQTVDSSASAFGELLCRSAIEDGQSYGEWTKDMVATLGREQTVSFAFFYR